MFVRTQENYRKVFKSIVGLKPDLRIFVLTLFNILVGTYLERETSNHSILLSNPGNESWGSGGSNAPLKSRIR